MATILRSEIVSSDAHPWGWDCDPCGEHEGNYETSEAAHEAAEEHAIEVESELNRDLIAAATAGTGALDWMGHEDYLAPECEIRIVDDRHAAIVSLLTEIREAVR